jgi:succinyl-diaminopimelate desuccinylase
VVQGKQGHVAYPHLADNPIPGMMKLVQGVLAEPLDHGTVHFGATNCEFTTLDVGNKATNVIPNEVRATFNIRFNDIWTPETLEAEIRKRLDQAAGNSIRYEARFEQTNAIAFMTQPGPFVEKMSAAIEAMTGIKPQLSTTGGTSDARFICKYGPVIEFGLIGKTMHQIDEHADVAELEALAKIYEGAIERYFAS